MVAYEYFYIKYFVILKNMLNISNFHGKTLRKKTSPPLFLVISLVKFRNSKKNIAWKLQRDPMFELLDVISAHKEAFGQIIHCLLLVPKALPGETYTPGVSSYVPGGSGWKMVINLHQLQFISCTGSQTCFWQRNILQVPLYCFSIHCQHCSQRFYFFHNNFLDI